MNCLQTAIELDLSCAYLIFQTTLQLLEPEPGGVACTRRPDGSGNARRYLHALLKAKIWWLLQDPGLVFAVTIQMGFPAPEAATCFSGYGDSRVLNASVL